MNDTHHHIPDHPDNDCGTARLTSDNLAQALEALGYKIVSEQPLTDKQFPILLGLLNTQVGNTIRHLIDINNPDAVADFTIAAYDAGRDWDDVLEKSLMAPFLVTTSLTNEINHNLDNTDFNAGAANTISIAFTAIGLLAELCRYHSTNRPKHDSTEIYRLTRDLAGALHLIADKHLFDPPKDS